MTPDELKEFEKKEKAHKDKTATVVPDGYVSLPYDCPKCESDHVIVQPYTPEYDEKHKVIGKSASGPITCMRCGGNFARVELKAKKKWKNA